MRASAVREDVALWSMGRNGFGTVIFLYYRKILYATCVYYRRGRLGIQRGGSNSVTGLTYYSSIVLLFASLRKKSSENNILLVCSSFSKIRRIRYVGSIIILLCR